MTDTHTSAHADGATESTFVFRVEAFMNQGNGPFMGALMDAYYDGAMRAIRARREINGRIPASATIEAHRSGIDSQLPIGPDHLFGCQTLEQLRVWFPSPAGCASMAQIGGVLAAYRVPTAHVLKGPYEVAFDARYAELVDWYSLRDLHNWPMKDAEGCMFGDVRA